MGQFMSIAPNIDLTVEIMNEVTTLADSIVSKAVTSTAEMTYEANKIAEPAGLEVGDIFDLMLGHIKMKFPKADVTLNTEAYNVLKSFRNRQ